MGSEIYLIMNFRIGIIILFLFIQYNVNGQSDGFMFTSSYEKNIFQDKKKVMELAFILDADSLEVIKLKSDLLQYLETLKENLEGKSEKAKTKILYHKIQDQYFKEYRLTSSLTNTFKTGQFNCVSSSILYALVFDYYSIPYQLKQTPNHVYLIAFPKTYRILIESTQAKLGFIDISDQIKVKIVDDLVDKKIISKDKVLLGGHLRAYNEYMNSDENIDLRQAISLMYFNRALECSENEKYLEGISASQKAYYLNPANKQKYILTSMIAQNISNVDFLKISDFSLLLDYVNLSDNEESKRNLHYYFDDILRKCVDKQPKLEYCRNVFDLIKLKIKDTVLLNELGQSYYYKLCQYYVRSNNINLAIENAYKAYEIDINNDEVSFIFFDLLRNHFTSNLGNTTFSNLKKFASEHTALLSDIRYKKLILSFEMLLVAKQLYDGKFFEIKVLENLEESYELYKEDNDIKAAFSLLLSEFGAFFYRKSEYDFAKKVLEEAISINVYNELAHDRLEIVNDAIARSKNKKK